MPTPAAVRITSPPTPGRAAVASAHMEAASRTSTKAHAGKTTPHPSERRHRALAVPSRAAMTPHLSGWRAEVRCRHPPERCNPGRVAGPRHARDIGDGQEQRQSRRDRRIHGWRQPSTGDPSHYPHRAHYLPGDAQQEGVKVGLQLRELDVRTGNRGEHVLKQRDDVRNRRPLGPPPPAGAGATCRGRPRRRCPSRSSRPWCPCRQARYSGYSRRWKAAGPKRCRRCPAGPKRCRRCRAGPKRCRRCRAGPKRCRAGPVPPPLPCWPEALPPSAVRGGTAGTAGTRIGNGDRAPGTTQQQARCEHTNTGSEAQLRQIHHLFCFRQRSLRSAATPGAKPVGERRPEVGWVGGPAETTAAVHERPAGLPQKIAKLLRTLDVRPASPR